MPPTRCAGYLRGGRDRLRDARAGVRRLTFEGQGTRVIGVYPGPIDTDMAGGLPLDKTPAPVVANAILDAIERGDEDVLPDAMSQQLGGAYLADPKGLERMVAAM